MQATTSPLIRLEGATKRFAAARAFELLSLSIPPGEFVAIVGRSGAGKTTLLRCLAGAATLSDGAIRFGDENLGALRGAPLHAHRRRVGMIYQHFNLVRRLSVLENVLVGRLGHLRGWRAWMAMFGRFSATDRGIAARCLAHVGLLDRAWQRADTLSGGELQRVAIARVLAQRPELVLADEPVASLDVLNGRLVMQTLRDISTGGRLTVVATLHHVEYARRYADRVLGLRDGQLVFDGPAATLTDAAVGQIFGESGVAWRPLEPTVPLALGRLASASS
jgi:phosphonate transport system ATP-binding protein